jgi:serine/threonine protein kinase
MLADFGLGKLDDDTVEAVNGHLETCADCCALVASIANDSFVDRLRAIEGITIRELDSHDVLGRSRHTEQTLAGGDSFSSDTDEPGRAAFFSTERDTDLVVPPELAAHPDYEIVRELGRGGMGVVYLARNRVMDRLEVLKLVNKGLLRRRGALERFQQEIRSAARLNHPNIVAAYTVLRPGDLLAFAMEYVKGEDLSAVVKRQGPLPVVNAVYYAHQVAQGLQHAYEQGMVHRDIKPNNLILAIRGKKHVVKILDFGLAKATREKRADDPATLSAETQAGLTQAGQMLGTPDYMAPEQALDAQCADIRADIYSLGCTLYYLLAGRRPFEAATLAEVIHAHCTMAPTPLEKIRPEASHDLAAVVARMMAKDPASRYQTPNEVAKALAPFFKSGARGSGEQTEIWSSTAVSTLSAPSPAVGPPAANQPSRPASSRAGFENNRADSAAPHALSTMRREGDTSNFAGPAPNIRRLQVPANLKPGQQGRAPWTPRELAILGVAGAIVVIVFGLAIMPAGSKQVVTSPKSAPISNKLHLPVDPTSTSLPTKPLAPAIFIVDVSPPEAIVTVDDQQATLSNIGGARRLEVPFERDQSRLIRLSAQLDNYVSLERTLQAKTGLIEAVSLHLQPTPKTAIISLDVTPPEAFVKVDDPRAIITREGAVRRVELDLVGQSARPVTIVAKLDGYTSSERRLVVRPGLAQSVSIRLQAIRLPSLPGSSRPASAHEVLTSTDWAWSEPERIGEDRPLAFSVSGDGLLLASQLSGDAPGYCDLWLQARSKPEAVFGSRTSLGPSVNSAAHEHSPWLSADGLTLVFGSDRPLNENRAAGASAPHNLWISSRPSRDAPFEKAKALAPPINSGAHQTSGALTGDGLMLIFASSRPGGRGGSDLWQSQRASLQLPWSEPTNLGPLVNGDLEEDHPWLSPDGRILLFEVAKMETDSDGKSKRTSAEIWITSRPNPTAMFEARRTLDQPVVKPGVSNSHPSMTADGKLLFFRSTRGQFSELWVSRRVPR